MNNGMTAEDGPKRQSDWLSPRAGPLQPSTKRLPARSMNKLQLEEYIASLTIPELLDLIRQLVSELMDRYMSEAE